MPAITSVAPVSPVTVAGTVAGLVVPLPSWPSALRPQHRTEPSAVRVAQVWASPAPRTPTPVRPVTVTGTLLGVVVPLPS